MILTVDIGNSRIKCASWQAEVIIARGVTGYTTDTVSDAIDKLLSGVEKPLRVFAVCVASEAVRPALEQWVSLHWGIDVEFLKTEKQFADISNAYHDPEQHGADRWAGVVAGHILFPGSSLCVISAGTAFTFDFVNKSGQHLGGYILPSFTSMHAALTGDTARVESISSESHREQGIPVNTDDAVNQGLHRLIQAGVREFCQLAQQELDDPVQVIITGGFAGTVLGYPKMPVMLHQPDLVMQGLYFIMKQQKSG